MGVGVCLLMFFKQRKIWACSVIIIIFFFYLAALGLLFGTQV